MKIKRITIMNRRTAISAICLTGLLPTLMWAQPLAEGKNKFLGNVIRNDPYSHYGWYWNQVTPENAGKWGMVEGTRDSYYWVKLDEIYQYAKDNGMIYKHHTLIWGQQQPGWIGGLDSASQRAEIEEWIQLVGVKYPGMDFVDVVNEPIHAPPAYMDALGGEGATGWDWVITSFELARQYLADSVKLVLNEYNVLHSNSTTDEYLALIELLNTRGLIDAIGIQGHYFELRYYEVSTLKSNLNRLAATGLPVYITEFDIDEADDAVQLEKYQKYFPLFWEHPGVKGMTLWGYFEGFTWKPYAYILDYRLRPRPALDWLRDYMDSPFTPVLISPVWVSGQPRNPLLLWHPSESATAYHVQLASGSVITEYTVILDSTVTDTTLQVGALNANSRYCWRVNASNESGTSLWSDIVNFVTGDQIIATQETTPIATEYRLFQNYPNPFNPATTISYSLAAAGHVRLQLYDLTGREIQTLVNTWMPAGIHSIQVTAGEMGSGIYFYRITAPGFESMKRMILIK